MPKQRKTQGSQSSLAEVRRPNIYKPNIKYVLQHQLNQLSTLPFHALV